MIKKALATAGIAATIVGAGASSALAAPAQDAPKDEGHNVICDSKGPGDKADYAGILSDEMLKLPIIDKSIILGLCGHKSDPSAGKGGEQGGDQGKGGDQQTPKPGEGNEGGDAPSFPAAL